MQYDGRPERRLGVRVGTWDIGSLSANGGEACEELRKRMNDVQEMERTVLYNVGDDRKEI